MIKKIIPTAASLLLGLCFPCTVFSQETSKESTMAKKKSTINRHRWVVDQIVARVNGSNILLSDINQPRINKEGERYNLQEVIEEEIYVQKAAKKHLLARSQDINRQIVSFKMANNLTDLSDAEFEEQLKETGFTFTQYRRQLGRILTVENVKRVEINDKVYVPSQEVEAYYDKHPAHTEEQYNLKVASLSYDEKQHYQKLVKEGKVSWKSMGWVNKSELDPRYLPALALPIGKVSKPIALSDGRHLLVTVVDHKDRRLKTLEERYREIEQLLQEEKRKALLGAFQEELFKGTSIVILI